MKVVWRWLKRLTLGAVLISLGLGAPVAYTEAMCRPEGDPDTYQATLPPEHHRLETRTLLTYPEWHIVHAYEDYARVVKVADPHDYQFLTGISGFWGSLCELSKASGQLGAVDGATKQMVYVIGVSFTAELLAKAAYEETIGRLITVFRGDRRAPLDDVSAQQAHAYAAFLQQVPWYKWDFRADAQALEDSGTGGLRDRERRIALRFEYRIKSIYAELIAAAVSEVGPDALTLRMIVNGLSETQLEQLDGVTVIGETTAGIEIETVRYRALTHLLQMMAQNGGEFVEIAGNDDILFTVLSDTPSHPKALDSAVRQGFGDYRHLVLTKVTDLAGDLRAIEAGAARLEHIHDY